MCKPALPGLHVLVLSMKVYWRQISASFTIATILASACNPTATQSISENAIIAAKSCLANADYSCALAQYELIDPTNDQEIAEVQTGIALATMGQRLQDLGHAFAELADALQGDEGSAPPLQPAGTATNLSGDSFIDRIIYSLLSDDWDNLLELLDIINTAAESGANLPVEFPAIPFWIGDIPVVELSGTVYPRDLLVFRSVLNYAAAGMALLLATDFNFPLIKSIRYALSLPQCRRETDGGDTERCLSLLGAYAINNSKTLLSREAVRGEHFQALVLEQLAQSGEGFQAYVDWIQTQPQPAPDGTGAPATRVVQYTPSGVESGDHLGTIAVTLRELAWDPDQIESRIRGQDNGQAPTLSDPNQITLYVGRGQRQAAQDLIDHLRTGTPEFMNFNQTLTPQLYTLLQVVDQSDVIGIAAQIMLSGFDPEVARVIVEIVPEIKDLLDLSDSPQLFQLAIAAIGLDSVEVSYRATLASETGLRAWVPAAVTNDTFADLPTWNWMVEWECDRDQVGILGCDASAPLSDTAHFVGTALEITADTIESRVAYVANNDPSMGGFVRANFSKLNDGSPDEIKFPDLQELNALLRTIMEAVILIAEN